MSPWQNPFDQKAPLLYALYIGLLCQTQCMSEIMRRHSVSTKKEFKLIHMIPRSHLAHFWGMLMEHNSSLSFPLEGKRVCPKASDWLVRVPFLGGIRVWWQGHQLKGSAQEGQSSVSQDSERSKFFIHLIGAPSLPLFLTVLTPIHPTFHIPAEGNNNARNMTVVKTYVKILKHKLRFLLVSTL